MRCLLTRDVVDITEREAPESKYIHSSGLHCFPIALIFANLISIFSYSVGAEVSAGPARTAATASADGGAAADSSSSKRTFFSVEPQPNSPIINEIIELIILINQSSIVITVYDLFAGFWPHAGIMK